MLPEQAGFLSSVRRPLHLSVVDEEGFKLISLATSSYMLWQRGSLLLA
jgi:hypothetical protein